MFPCGFDAKTVQNGDGKGICESFDDKRVRHQLQIRSEEGNGS